MHDDMTDTTDASREAEASRRLAEVFGPEAIDALLADAQSSRTPIDGVDGLLNQMTKAVIERMLQTEMTHTLGYERDDPAGAGSGNSRNGTSRKTISTTNGPVTLDVPRDRNGEFEPKIVPKRARRLGQIDEMILSLYARGLSTRDIEAHLLEVYGVKASRELISNVTEVVTDEITLWQNRPVDEVYPIVYIDGIRIKVRDKGAVTVKVAHLVIGVDVEGRKHALGVWIAEAEGAKFWHSVLTALRNRGLRDILIACCDGLTGLPEAITSVFPDTVVQTCVVHVVRNTGAVRVLPGSQEGRRRYAPGLHRADAGGRRARTQEPRHRVRHPVPRGYRRVAPGVERVHPIPRLPRGTPPDRLHHQRNRIHQLPAEESHQDPRALPVRRGRDEATLPRTAQHLQQERR